MCLDHSVGTPELTMLIVESLSSYSFAGWGWGLRYDILWTAVKHSVIIVTINSSHSNIQENQIVPSTKSQSLSHICDWSFQEDLTEPNCSQDPNESEIL